MATDDKGKEGLSAGAMAKELGISPNKVKKTLAGLDIEPDFVRANCGYYYLERTEQVRMSPSCREICRPTSLAPVGVLPNARQ